MNLCPSSSDTVRRSTPFITSRDENVWRSECQLKPCIFALAMRTQTSSEGTKAEDAPHAAVFQDPQRPESGLVQRDVAHFAVLCSGNGQNLVPKVDMLPEHFVLFAAPQTGAMNFRSSISSASESHARTPGSRGQCRQFLIRCIVRPW